ncbi:LysR family transcriptional regulator [Acuticoccus sp. M5D2P5]|uniref:LysR family transcriptional regulator n=1 Tax=Acuticoccus kalidii TaxID=2910977 RepID=UPI001F1EFBF8|nr:LysR family transcriptional regulator [Acuticoccus kalidii]MCF3932684.1 LysR family transcriptional regulator [Acuticoccus kalidii]
MAGQTLDIRRLTYFAAIVREGSLTAAAQALGIAQPALSHHLAQIEKSYGVKLVERHARGVVATEAGRTLQAHAEKIMRELAHTEALLREHSTSPSGEIVVGIISSLAGITTGPLLAAVTQDMPRVRLHIEEGNSQTLARGLAENRIDLVVSLSAPLNATSEALADEPLTLVSNHALAPKGPNILLADALQLPLVLSTHRHIMRSIVEGAASQFGLSANVVHEVDGNATIRSAVLGGFGHTIMGQASFDSDYSQSFRSTPIVGPSLYRRIILRRNDVAINQVVSARISDVIRDIAAGLIHNGQWRAIRPPDGR